MRCAGNSKRQAALAVQSGRLALAAVLFPLAHRVLGVFVVSDQTAARADTGADERAFAAAQQTADHGAARRGASDDLGFGVVVGIMVMLLPPGAGVGFLAQAVQWGEREGGQNNKSVALQRCHGVDLSFEPAAAG